MRLLDLQEWETRLQELYLMRGRSRRAISTSVFIMHVLNLSTQVTALFLALASLAVRHDELDRGVSILAEAWGMGLLAIGALGTSFLKSEARFATGALLLSTGRPDEEADT